MSKSEKQKHHLIIKNLILLKLTSLKIFLTKNKLLYISYFVYSITINQKTIQLFFNNEILINVLHLGFTKL